MAVAGPTKEIKTLFEHYSENGIMTADHLRSFLVEIQKQDNATVEEARAIIDQFHDAQKGLKLEGFFKYLFSDNNPPLDTKRGVHHDMTAPLSHYYIFTGHNSYLTGNQLSSDCSDYLIIDALLKGVRVIELDIWPNDTKDDVHVLHGRTLTAPVALIKCLRSIKEHAFTASEYPVVITLEDHLTPDLQAKVAEMVTQTFGDVLFSPGSECLKEFPSPEFLKKRIIISTKPPKEYLKAKDINENEKETSDSKADDKDELDEDSDDEEDTQEGDIKLQRSVEPEYVHLIAIQAGKPKGGLDECLKVVPEKVRRLSLSEPQLEKAAETHAKEIVSCSVCLKDNLMGPRWKGKGSEAKALADPMSIIVSQLRSSLIEIAADGLLSGCSVLLAVEAEQTELLTRACFGRPIIAVEKDKQLIQLGLEEAFYLFHYLRCLKIGKYNCEENVDQLWHYMKSKKGSFPEFYKAYSHLRKKNWVVRPGSQYGVDFIAYRHHPSLVHSEYAVLVLSAEGGDVNGRLRVLSDFHCTIRLCGSVVKTLLVLWVNKNGYGANSPSCLEDYSIEEMTVTRWSPEQSRENQTATKNGAKIVENKQVQ